MVVVRAVIMLFVLVAMQQVYADDLYLVLNGKSYHLEDRNFNEKNIGLGMEWDISRGGNWIPFVAASEFKDSHSNPSRYLGGGVKYRYHFDADPDGWYSDLGMIAFLMTRHDWKNNNPFFGALPFATLGYGPVALNFTYIPRVTPKSVPLFYIQAKVRIYQW